MRPTDMEPKQEELEEFLDDEERGLLNDPDVPDDVKAEIRERLERFREEDLEVEQADDVRVPVRLFLNELLLRDVDDDVYKQIVNATRFPGTKLVVITPDVHQGYGVPV
ncbi:MAG TPA: hypothetical protein VNF68_00120 [Candidatus Baltobacteraceae bacterium]|nr:hypothetical protein [Candidatus Baltobacteraceae bacterium]